MFDSEDINWPIIGLSIWELDVWSTNIDEFRKIERDKAWEKKQKELTY